MVISQVKAQCVDAIESLIVELDVRFPDVEFLMALGIVFP